MRKMTEKLSLASLHYRDADFEIIRSGQYVLCAVSGLPIALEQLVYWSVDLQEAYAGPEQAMQRWKGLQVDLSS